MALYPEDSLISPIRLDEYVWWKTKKGVWKSGRVVKISEKIVRNHYTEGERRIRNISVEYVVNKLSGDYTVRLGGLKKFYRNKPYVA